MKKSGAAIAEDKPLDANPWVSLAVALPVWLGSLGRIPLGLLTDSYGGRKTFALGMAGSITPVIAVCHAVQSPSTDAHLVVN